MYRINKKKKMTEKEGEEQEQYINNLYEELLREYDKEKMTTVSKTRSKFAMDVHEKMKQEQIEKILNELDDIVNKINEVSSGNKTKLYERFEVLVEKFNEITNYTYGGKKKKTASKKKKKTVSKKKKKTASKINKKTASKKKKKTASKKKIK
jgi:hypothetical protein